ncbi:class I SAM-dependent methyltransferase [Desulfatiglans anilini]|uniref:class I SAM-dependent methyltransferase n=1 Tax=Desulfatiglans anilini TaxID=90728 RepID=UPI0004017F1B|nr:class I SAM-dependent methyltransferase [Desulfatiglans anilini]
MEKTRRPVQPKKPFLHRKALTASERGKGSSFLSLPDWDRVAAAIGESLGKPDFDYFRNDKLDCYDTFYFADRVPAPMVLDVGCGPGHFMLFAARNGAKVTGLDASAGMLRLTRQRLESAGFDGLLLQTDLDTRLPFQEATFDLVVCESVLNHIRRPADVLEEIFRVLKKDGTFVLDVSNAWGLPWRTAIRLAQWTGSYPEGRIHWLTPRRAERLVENAGFRVHETRGLHLIPPPRFTSIGFRSRPLLPPAAGLRLERLFYRLNQTLERTAPFKHVCFKYLIKSRKP